MMPLPSLAGFEGNGWALAGMLLAIVTVMWFRHRVPWIKADSEAEHQRFDEAQEHIRVLQDENKGLRQQLVDMDDRWRERMALLEREYDEHRRECRKETDELHTLIRDLTKQVDGLQRQIAQHSQSTANMLGDMGNA